MATYIHALETYANGHQNWAEHRIDPRVKPGNRPLRIAAKLIKMGYDNIVHVSVDGVSWVNGDRIEDVARLEKEGVI